MWSGDYHFSAATVSGIAFAKLYDRKTPITAADLLNDRVLTDPRTEYCGAGHAYELYLALEDIDHTRTKAKSP